MKKNLIYILLILLVSCVQEIPVEELENEQFVETPVDGAPTPVADTTAPTLSGLLPMGTLPESTTSVNLQVITNEEASCRYDLMNKTYGLMLNNFLSLDQKSHFFSLNVTNDTSYTFYVRCQDLKQNESTFGVISFSVDKKGAVDNMAPLLSNLLPVGEVASGTKQVTLQVSSNEASICKYSTNQNANFDQMVSLNTSSGVTHQALISGLMDGANYNYYVLCKDLAGNQSVKGQISFSVKNLELDGAKLYSDNCMSCHGNLAGSSKRNRTASVIDNAIKNVTQMNSLSFLQITQIEEIAKVLKDIDTKAPTISDPRPVGILAKTTTVASLSVKTDESASCRYSLVDQNYDLMNLNLVGSANNYIHSGNVTVQAGQSYRYYVRCIDNEGNKNISSALINFQVEAADAPDVTAPTLLDLSPSGKLASGTKSINLTLKTNEDANCRYSANSGQTFAQMILMGTTGNLDHSQTISGLNDGNTYTYYVSCQDGANNISTIASISFEVPILNLDGPALYAENCMGCHGPLATSNKKNRSTVQIKDAIIQNGTMSRQAYLKLLTDAQIDAIATALKTNSNPMSGDGADAEQKYVIGTRRYLVSKFSIIFINESKNADDNSIESVINNLLKNNQAGDFGGTCTAHSDDCPGETEENQYAALMLPHATSVRRAYVIRACKNILNYDRAVNNALSLAGLNTNLSGDNSLNIEKIFDVFYPGVEISSEVRDDLRQVYVSAKSNGFSNIDAWRMIMNSMCQSAMFELY